MLKATALKRFRIQGKDGASVDPFSLDGKTLLFYFSAHWCPPCRQFTPLLAKFYEQHKDSKNFEILFCSWDHDEAGFTKYHAEHPWPAIHYADRKAVETLQEQYEVFSIPTLIVLGPSGELMTKEGRNMVLQDPEALNFPWKGVTKAPQAQAAYRMRLAQQAGLVVLFLGFLWFMTTPRMKEDHLPLP